MAAPYNPPVSGEDFVIRVSLEDYATPGRFKSNPTIAAGDFKIDKDGAGLNNPGTLPSVDPASTKLVKIALTGTEMTAGVVTIICSDQTDPPEWCDLVICIPTTT
jgi:hypothetical protein